MVGAERVAFGLVNLAAAALAVRAVGIEAFGVVALLQSYARLAGELAQFQTWQAVIRFGAEDLAAGDRARLGRLLGLTLRLDALALGGAAAVAALAAAPLGRALGLPPAVGEIAPWFALAVLFIIPNSGTGVLRLFGRVPDLAAQHAVNATARLVGSAWLFVAGGDVAGLAAVWLAAGVLSGLWIMARAALLLRAEGLAPDVLGSWRAAGRPGLWRFLWGASASASMGGSVGHLSTLAVGAALGAGEAGLFAVARQLAEAAAKPAKLLGPLIFPDLAWLTARGDRAALRALALRCAALALGAFALLTAAFVLAGRPVLVAAFGAEAAAAWPALALAGGAAGFALWGFALEPMLMSLGRVRAVVLSQLGGLAAFAATLALALPAFGAAGAAGALLAHAAAVFAGRAAAVGLALRTPA